MELKPNPGKKLIVEVNGIKYARYPIKTRFVGVTDRLEDIIEKYVLPFTKESDIVVLSQKIVSISQKRIIIKKISGWDSGLSFFPNLLKKPLMDFR